MLCVRPIKTKFFYKCFVSSNRYSSFYYIKTVTKVDEDDLYISFKDKETEWSWFLDQCELKRTIYDRDKRLQKLGIWKKWFQDITKELKSLSFDKKDIVN